MSLDEISDGYTSFLQKGYPEDIVQRIRQKAYDLYSLALKENNEVAIWALNYLMDD